ncbi:MAG: discoidin domain-containing protein, partial [Clostridium sp.]
SDKTPTMTVDLGQMTKFDTVIISEMLDTWVTPNQYRCLKFKVEYYDGNKWEVINEGTTIGEELTINFDSVTGSKIRLTVLENTPNNNNSPANIVEFEVYNTKEDEVVEDIKKVTNLKVTEKFANSVKLSWEAPKEGTEVAEYIIYKDGKEIDTVSSIEKLEYEAENLRTNTNYGFKVVSKGTGGSVGKPVSVNVRTTKK